MRRYLGLALAFLLAVVSVSALAMGLGEIRLNSQLNQRLDAEIELVSAAADELESLKVGLASREAYARYGLEREDILSTLQFRVARRPNGTAYVKVTSSEAIKEPFLTFLIEANWSRGKLLREYTVLLDPPTFANRKEGASAPGVAQVPAVRPEQPAERARPDEQAREPVVVQPWQPEPAAEQPIAAEDASGDVISVPSLDSELDESATTGNARQTGGTYGPIQRNETLWGLAMRLRPDDSITINQMMMALYRANPEAFQGNINRLKAGYILRIPEYSEIRAVDRGAAFREAKRHNDEWEAARSGRTQQETPVPAADSEQQLADEPELSLVAPEEEPVAEPDTGIGAGGEAGDLGTAAESGTSVDDVDRDALGLELESDSPERLLDIEDEALQALQSQDELAAPAESPETTAPALPADDAPAQTDKEVATGEGGEVAITEPEVAVTEPVETQPVVAPVRGPQPGLSDRITGLVLSPLGLGIAAAVLVMLLAGVLLFRKRREEGEASAAAAGQNWYREGETDDDLTLIADANNGDDVSITARQASEDEAAGAFDHDAGGEDTGTRKRDDDVDSTQGVDEAGKTQLNAPASGSDNFEDALVGGQAVTLDDNDPTSEADFHMAYGLYDQATEVVERALERDPSRTGWIAKLAEIHFAANNTERFLDAARRLREHVGPGDSDWDNVAIMGRQIAADDPMFSEDNATTGSVDLDFGSADEEFGEPASAAKAEAPADAGTDDLLDFDMSFDSPAEPTEEAEPAAKAETPASTGNELDYDMDLADFGVPETPAEVSEEKGTESDSDFDFDLNELGDEAEAAEPSGEETGSSAAGLSSFDDAETQTEFDRALQELSAYVDTNLPERDAGDAVSGEDGADLNLDEFNFDQPGNDVGDGGGEGIGDDEEDLGEIGTKLDLARAYIDMGDPDGARAILDEVLADGDEDQKKEAQDLMAQLG